VFKNVQGKWIWLGGVAIGLFSFGYGLLYRDRFVDLLARPRDFFFRVESIQSAFEIIQSHWLIGTGLNNYFSYLIGVQKNFSPVFLQPPHNVFVLVLLQTGILGLILFVTFVVQTFGQLLHRSQKSKGLDKTLIQATIVVLVIALFAGLTDHFFLTVQQGQLLIAVLIGIAWNNKVYG
jgi:O-antigen ligase